jgi:glycosyltransferase involved in cell wall biosynthesis
MPAGQQSARVAVDGKFFRVGTEKFIPRGVTYGPFVPDSNGETFGTPEQVARDFAQIRELNANVARVYYVPPRWLLDLAEQHGLKVFVDIPWEKHRCFLESYEMREAARENVRVAARTCAGHSALFAFSVANEIPAEIVRWHGADEVARFVDDLVAEVKEIDVAALCTFASFPPTEFLQPRAIDFVTFNVYLHERTAFENYLARLQTLANDKPLVLGEFGACSLRETEPRKCEMLRWQIESAFRNGLAGTVLFSFTDDWFRGGQQIADWSFGLTTRERVPKESFAAVREAYKIAPHFPLTRTPKVSVVVASYNGAATLRACLQSLTRLNYPNYEVILVDDGSTDDTQQIAAEFPAVRNIRQNNLGLSAARNTGIAAATGEIVAFTDSDCRADEDWLYYLVNEFSRSDFVAIGGHNFLPPEDSPVAAAVLVSPGGPAHVMLSDREAEHIPGCNMAFYKWALDEIKGFDPLFRKAGDDVDLCWRLQERGYKIGFAASAFVWHYRRSTVKAYLKQQAGYGEAEALLLQKHPEYFNVLGSGTWRGRIYAAGLPGIVLQRAVIYHGVFGSGFFQKLYAREPSFALMICTSLQFHLFVTLPLLIATSWWIGFLPAALLALGLSLGVCGAAATQALLPANRTCTWSRPLVALMFFLQPLVRGWARYERRLLVGQPKTSPIHVENEPPSANPICFWSGGTQRYAFLEAIQGELEKNGWQHRIDSGWDKFDFEISTNRWSTAQLTTVHEELAEGRRFFRCRVDTHSSWTSWLLVLFLALASSFTVLLLRGALPYVWFALALTPMALLFVATEERRQSELIESLVAQAARHLGFEEWKDMRSGLQTDLMTTDVVPRLR